MGFEFRVSGRGTFPIFDFWFVAFLESILDPRFLLPDSVDFDLC